MEAPDAAQPKTPSPPFGRGSGNGSMYRQPPLIPDYELISCIGVGSYGEVWLARSALGTFRAVKIVARGSFEHDQPFEREFKGIQRFEPISLTHESQVKILHVGRNEAAGYFYYVMELADDAGNKKEKSSAAEESKILSVPFSARSSTAYVPRTLKHELQTRGRLPVEECVQIGLALTTALAHLHEHRLIHRDVKPSNIIFVNGVPKLADIGLVTDIEATRSFVGTEGFIPPEGPGTVSADLYSLGKVLYEISMGRSRLDFPALPANWDEIPQADQARLLEFNEVLVKACESAPKRRYASAPQMHDELQLLQRGKSVKDTRTRERHWAAAKKLGLTGAAAALLITTGIFLNGFKLGHRPDPRAGSLYEWGQWYYNQLTPEDHRKAFEYFTQAIQADPKFIEPYGELTMLYVWGDIPGFHTDEERWQKARAIADKVLAIDPSHAEGHIALSFSHFLKRDWRGAEAEILQAVKLNPKLPIPHCLYCYYLAMQRRTEEARREGHQAELLEPPAGYRLAAILAAWPFIAERRFDLAIAELRKALDQDRTFVVGYTFLGKCYEAQGNYSAALDAWNQGDLIAGEDAPDKVTAVYKALRQAYATSGVQGYCRKWIELTLGEPAHPEEKKMFPEYDLPGYYALLGEKAKALKWLEDNFDRPNVWTRIKFEPLYDSLHNEPRYQALVVRARLAP
jgi:serine/threonine protein kinase/tetratricopeptide (TPR) repeat protein